MEKTLRPRVKVCCISTLDEARLAVSMGADAVGLVSVMPSGPGVIEDQVIADIARQVPPGVARFLLTSRQDVRAILAAYRQEHRALDLNERGHRIALARKRPSNNSVRSMAAAFI